MPTKKSPVDNANTWILGAAVGGAVGGIIVIVLVILVIYAQVRDTVIERNFFNDTMIEKTKKGSINMYKVSNGNNSNSLEEDVKELESFKNLKFPNNWQTVLHKKNYDVNKTASFSKVVNCSHSIVGSGENMLYGRVSNGTLVTLQLSSPTYIHVYVTPDTHATVNAKRDYKTINDHIKTYNSFDYNLEDVMKMGNFYKLNQNLIAKFPEDSV